VASALLEGDEQTSGVREQEDHDADQEPDDGGEPGRATGAAQSHRGLGHDVLMGPRPGAGRRLEDGSVVVEFALLLPILLLLLLGAVQVGVIARDQLLLTQSSRAGAREAAITDSEPAVLEAAIRAAPGSTRRDSGSRSSARACAALR
jgi:hypothetical protein